MTPAERLDGLAQRGVWLYLGETGELRARCEPCFAHVLDAAIPAIRQHRAALIAHLAKDRFADRAAHEPADLLDPLGPRFLTGALRLVPRDTSF